LLLGPAVLVVCGLFRLMGGEATAATLAKSGWRAWVALVPWFVGGFLGLAMLRSLGLLPDAIAQPGRDVSRVLMVLAMAGLGFGVELAAVRTVGPRVALAVVCSLAFMATFTLACMRLPGLQG